MSDAERADAGTRREALRLMWWLVVPVLVLLAILTQLQYEQRFEHAEQDLLVRAIQHAQDLEALARPAEAHIQDLRQLLQAHWYAPPRTGPALRQALRALPAPTLPGRAKPLPPDGWSLDEAPAELRREYGQIWWAPPDGRPPDGLWMDRAALFLRSAAVVHARSPGFQGSYFVASELNISWGFPWIDTPTMLSSMGAASLQALDEMRVASVSRGRRLLAEDPTDLTYWGKPYVGQLDGELVQSHGSILVVDGRYAGEVSVDFRIDSLQHKLAGWQERADSRVWIIDLDKNIVADSHQPLRAPAGNGFANLPVEIKLPTRLPAELTARPLELKLEPKGNSASIQHAGPWLLVTATRSQSPWIYAEIVPRNSVRAAVLPSLLPNAVLGLALLSVFIAGQWLFARWFVTPALGVLQYLRQLTADPSTPEPPVDRRWRGWVRAVTQTVRRQQEAQTQLEHQRETLRQNEKLSAMGTLLASVTHELNNPLAIVMGRASLLEERVLSATDADSPAALAVRDDSRRIREAADRCSRIVRTFLNMARQRPPTRSAVPLGEVVRSALDMLGYTLRSQGVHVHLQLAEGLPDVQADPDQIGQVVLNLIVNAQQAMAQCSAPRVLTLSSGQDAQHAHGPWTRASSPYVWLRVADTGPGVPPAHQAQVFEPFFTTKERGMGTGLGLSVSRRIAREHDGDLVLESSDGGAVFCLLLPMAIQALGPEDPAGRGADPTADPAEVQRLLVVDGVPQRVEFMRSVLETAGFEVASAESGAVAVELLGEARFDAVVSDTHLPDIDGLALWQAVRKLRPELADYMLFVTDEPVTADAARVLMATGKSCVKAPMQKSNLLRAVNQLLSTAQT